jgi:hypothetical protein
MDENIGEYLLTYLRAFSDAADLKNVPNIEGTT